MNSDNTPTLQEIRKQLPRWACVALAARCASRVETLLSVLWPEVSAATAATVRRAIESAEAAAAGRTSTDKAAEMTAEVARAAKASPFDASIVVRAAVAAAGCASAALSAAAAASASTTPRPKASRVQQYYGSSGGFPGTIHVYDDPKQSATWVAQGAMQAWSAALNALRQKQLGVQHPAFLQAALAAMRADFGMLATMAKDLHWTDETHVDPDALGDLWPLGPPEGWPGSDEPSKHSIPAFSFYLDPGNASEETIRAVLAAISKLYQAHGGSPLQFTPGDCFALTAAEVSR